MWRQHHIAKPGFAAQGNRGFISRMVSGGGLREHPSRRGRQQDRLSHCSRGVPAGSDPHELRDGCPGPLRPLGLAHGAGDGADDEIGQWGVPLGQLGLNRVGRMPTRHGRMPGRKVPAVDQVRNGIPVLLGRPMPGGDRACKEQHTRSRRDEETEPSHEHTSEAVLPSSGSQIRIYRNIAGRFAAGSLTRAECGPASPVRTLGSSEFDGWCAFPHHPRSPFSCTCARTC